MFETTNQVTLKKATLIYSDCIRIYYIDNIDKIMIHVDTGLLKTLQIRWKHG
jgi:hypothetical protein